MRGIERVLAGIVLLAAIGGAAVFGHRLDRAMAPVPATFAAPPPAHERAGRTVRITLPALSAPAATEHERRRHRAEPSLRLAPAAESVNVRLSLAPARQRVHVVAASRVPQRPAAASARVSKPAPKLGQAPSPVLGSGGPLALTPTDPTRILAGTSRAAPPPAVPTAVGDGVDLDAAPAHGHGNSNAYGWPNGNAYGHENGRGRGHAD